MSKVAVVYWSGTGNTEQMAHLLAEGATTAGAQVTCVSVDGFSAAHMDAYDAVAFGCPSMGCEELEDSEFLPVFHECEAKLSGKKVALFGSYGWGDGQWMRDWEENCCTNGAVMVSDCVICCGAPDEEAEKACRQLGAALA